jgi:hypothetical protein
LKAAGEGVLSSPGLSTVKIRINHTTMKASSVYDTMLVMLDMPRRLCAKPVGSGRFLLALELQGVERVAPIRYKDGIHI